MYNGNVICDQHILVKYNSTFKAKPNKYYGNKYQFVKNCYDICTNIGWNIKSYRKGQVRRIYDMAGFELANQDNTYKPT